MQSTTTINKNFLFVAVFEPLNHFLCPSFYYQIEKQTIKCDILNIFIDSNSIQQFYSDYFNDPFNQHKNKTYFKHYNNNHITLKEILESYISQYQFFIFLRPEHLLYQNFLQNCLSINESCNIYESNEMSKNPILFIPQIDMIKLFRNGLDLYSLYSFDNKYNKKVSDHYKCAPPLPRPTKYGENIIYENDFFILAKTKETLSSESILLDSYIYVNKRNNRVYNIGNNMVGTLISNNTFSIVIEWQLDDNDTKLVVEYRPNDIQKFYESFRVLK